MLHRRDVGHRIVVRRFVGIRDDRPQFSDALGELVELTDTHLTVVTVRGPVRVPLSEVHRAKRVPPPRRPAAVRVADIELAADEAWPAPDCQRLGDWRLRAAGGWTGRANSALPIGAPDRPYGDAIDAVLRWYAARALPARMNVPLPLAAPVNTLLDERGWSNGPLVVVQTMELAALLAATPERPGLPPVELRPAPAPAWLDVAIARKAGTTTTARKAGTTSTARTADSRLPAAAWHVLTAVDQVRFAHVYGDEKLLAVGRGTVTGGGRWLGLTLIEVIPDARRRGLGRHTVGALARWGAEVGATGAYLQVEEGNQPALALYARLGFTTHHSYATREAPTGDVGGAY